MQGDDNVEALGRIRQRGRIGKGGESRINRGDRK